MSGLTEPIHVAPCSTDGEDHGSFSQPRNSSYGSRLRTNRRHFIILPGVQTQRFMRDRKQLCRDINIVFYVMRQRDIHLHVILAYVFWRRHLPMFGACFSLSGERLKSLGCDPRPTAALYLPVCDPSYSNVYRNKVNILRVFSPRRVCYYGQHLLIVWLGGMYHGYIAGIDTLKVGYFLATERSHQPDVTGPPSVVHFLHNNGPTLHCHRLARHPTKELFMEFGVSVWNRQATEFCRTNCREDGALHTGDISWGEMKSICLTTSLVLQEWLQGSSSWHSMHCELGREISTTSEVTDPSIPSPSF